MSPNVGNFVHDLVEMAKAMETLPQVQDELDRANTALDNYVQMVQDRELAIVNYKDQIEQLHAKVRSLEVERDDASFRVLEAEDQAASVLNSARVAQAGLEAMIAKLDPPKPKPEPAEEPELSPLADQGNGEGPISGSLPNAVNTDNHGHYFNKRYIDIDGYVSRYDWEQGGGTQEDYDYRPALDRY